MRIGTLSCHIFGHKFIHIGHDYVSEYVSRRTTKQTDFCIKCGIDRPKNKKDFEEVTKGLKAISK